MTEMAARPPRAGARRAEARALLAIGLPLVGSQIAQIALHTTDTLMLGWYSVTALAALSIASTVFFLLFLLGAGFAWAVLPMVASAHAVGDDMQVRRTTRMGVWLSVLFSAVAMPVCFLAEPILVALGQEARIAELGGHYLAIAAFSLPTALVYQVLRSYLSALEHTGIILWGTLGVALVNAALNWVFIFGNLGAPGLGVRGAAVATVASNAIFVLVAAVYIQIRTPQYELFRNPLRPDRDAFGRVFRLGWPIGLTTLAEVGLFSAAAVMMGWLGELPLAAHGVAIQIASITFMVHLGLSQALTVRAGQAWGRSDREALAETAFVAMILSALAALAIIAIFLIMPEPLIGLFTDPDDPKRPAIMALGASFLVMAALFQLVDSGQVMAVGALRGVQDTRVPMWIASVSYWGIGLPAAWLLGFPLGLEGVGIWGGLTVGLAAACAALQWRFWRKFAAPSDIR